MRGTLELQVAQINIEDYIDDLKADLRKLDTFDRWRPKLADKLAELIDIKKNLQKVIDEMDHYYYVWICETYGDIQ